MEGTRGRCRPICLAARGDCLERLHKNLFPKKSKEQFFHDAIVEPLIVVVYILSSIFIFSTFEAHGNGQYGVNRSADWTLIDCTYFTAQTMSTVGYGDISPANKDGPRIFAVWMILVGIALVFPILGKWMIIFTADFNKWGRKRMEILIPKRKFWFAGDGEQKGEPDFEVPRHIFLYYFKNLLPSFFLCSVVQLISAGIFCGLENEQEYLDHADGTPCILSEPTNTEGITCGVGRLPWTYADALYHCVITATTVGYGDVRIATQRGRLFAAFHMVVSTAMVSDLLLSIGKLATARAEIMSRFAIIEKGTDPDLFERLMESARTVFPDKKHEDGITELEYVILMIMDLGIRADEKDVSVFVKHFRHGLDVDGNGVLNEEDIIKVNQKNFPLKEFNNWPVDIAKVAAEAQAAAEAKANAEVEAKAAEDALLHALHHTHKEATRLFLMAARQGATDAQIADALRQGPAAEKAAAEKANSAKPEATGPGIVKKLNLVEMRLNMRFESTGREGSVERQCFTRDLKQDLANASGMETSLFNILKLSQGSVIVDMIAPETAAQKIQRQSLDPFSKLRSGKITTFLEKVCLQNGRLLNHCNNIVNPAPPMTSAEGEGTYYESHPGTPCTHIHRPVPWDVTEVQHNNFLWPLQFHGIAQLDRGYQHPTNAAMPQPASATIGFSFPALFAMGPSSPRFVSSDSRWFAS